MVAHGFAAEFLAELVREGLATSTVENLRTGHRTRLRITPQG
jgi:hypothetical protein